MGRERIEDVALIGGWLAVEKGGAQAMSGQGARLVPCVAPLDCVPSSILRVPGSGFLPAPKPYRVRTT